MYERRAAKVTLLAAAPATVCVVELRYSGQARAEKIVAAARLIISVSFLLSLQLDPTSDGFFRRQGFILPVGYAIFAAVAFIVAWRRNGLRRWTIATHVIDILFFGINLLVPDASTTPRFLSVLFPLFSACLLFSWKSGLITVLISASVYLAGAIAVTQSQGSGVLLAEHFFYRTAGYAVIAALMLWARSREEILEQEIASLSAWPHDFGDRVPTRELLERVITVMNAPRVLMIWEEPDEPWLHVAWKFGDEFRWIREAPTKYEAPVNDELTECSFIARDARFADERVIIRSGDDITEWTGEPLQKELRDDFNIRSVMSIHLVGTTFTGRLFLLDKQTYTADDLLFGELVARFVVSRLDQFYLLHRAQQFAVGSERLRLSRDLHDGVLQSLTGAALQLEAVRALMTRDPAAALERLTEVQGVIATDQRELRSFIRQLRPAAAHETDVRLSDRFAQLADRFRKQWGLTVDVHLDGLKQLLPQDLKHEIYSIVSEAVANAAKHADAAHVEVRIDTTQDAVNVTVRDDGRGFPFIGHYDLQELNEMKRGPVTLKERVSFLGGNLLIDSTPHGSTVQVNVPYNWMGA